MTKLHSFRFIPDDTRIPFVRYRYWAYAFSGALVVLTLILLPTRGLNLGIDFRGGSLIEVGMPGAAADLAAMRSTLGGLGLGEVALQEFGAPSDVLIRIARQAGGEPAQLAAVNQVKAALAERFGPDVRYRRVEFVGPKVSADLLWGGTQATIYALIAILAYVWFRFEWQFAVGAVVALIHDALTTIGLFSLFGLEFNLTTIAAILTIIGYSINDTVVIYDRVRDNLRRYKAMPLPELIDRSVNETLARTVMTSLTTVLALIALVVFGGPVVRGFTIAMIWGVVVGTYSSVYVAAPMIIHLDLRREAPGYAGRRPGLRRRRSELLPGAASAITSWSRGVRRIGVYDCVIVGAGSAGCVLARRPSERGDGRSLRLEAGPTDRDRFIDLPLGFYRMIMPRLISSNTDAAAIMIGDKGADLIEGNRAEALAAQQEDQG